MKKNISILFFFSLACIAVAQPRYDILPSGLCWYPTPGQDSSLTRFTLVSSTGAQAVLGYLNAAGEEVDVSSGGTFQLCFCEQKDSVQGCTYFAEYIANYVLDIWLADSTSLSTYPGFTFPYNNIGDLSVLELHLDNFLQTYDPIQGSFANVQYDLDRNIQITVYNSGIVFGTAIYSNVDTLSGVAVYQPFSQDCTQDTCVGYIQSVSTPTINPLNPVECATTMVAYIGFEALVGDIEVFFNSVSVPFTYDSATGIITATVTQALPCTLPGGEFELVVVSGACSINDIQLVP